jgi:anaerobic selenocysteine-containing dehydrogenase
MLVQMNTTLNTGHAFSLARETIILPVLARDEEPQATTQESMFNFVRLSDGGPARHEGPKSEVEVIATLAEKVFELRNAECGLRNGEQFANGQSDSSPPSFRNPKSEIRNLNSPLDWSAMRDASRIRDAIAAIVPGYEKIAEIDRTKEEFHIGGRVFHQTKFPTANGRANLHAHDLPPLYGTEPGQLRLMTIRSEGQFNTVVYEDYDLYRGVDRRDVILIHPDDIRRLRLSASDPVTVTGPAGSLRGVHLHPFEKIRPGNVAMYYPEVNVIVGRQLDPGSRTPAFKCVIVTLASEHAASPLPVVAAPQLAAAH